MGYTTLASMTKVALATTIAGGIFVAGITWQGDGKVTNIKGNLDHMKGELSQAISDNEFLQGQFHKLQGAYASSVKEANSKIAGLMKDKQDLEAQKAELESQIEGLQSDLTNSEDKTAEKEELQTEVNRLEGELDKANKQISELEEYAQEADNANTYEAVDRTAFSIDEQELTDVPSTTTDGDSNDDSTTDVPTLEADMTKYTKDNYADKFNSFGTFTATDFDVRERPENSGGYEVTITIDGTFGIWDSNADGKTVDKVATNLQDDIKAKYGVPVNKVIFVDQTGKLYATKTGINPVYKN